MPHRLPGLIGRCLAVCAALLVVVAACTDDSTGAPSSGSADFGGNVSSYGDWNGALPDTTPTPPVPLPNSVLTASNGDAWVCQNSERELKKNFDGFLAPGMTSGVLWPGALIQGATLIDGTPAPITLPRSPISVSIDLAVPAPSRRVELPTSASVQDAVASLQRDADSRLGDIDVVPARVDFAMSEANATFQFMMDLGVYAKGSVPAALLGLEIPGKVSVGVSEEVGLEGSFQRHTIAVRLVQPMYTISFADEAMREPVDYLDPSVTDAQVRQAVDRGVIGPDNLPTYVKSVTYGRMLTYTMTSTFAAEASELKAATQAAFDLFKVGSASGGSSLTARQQLILSNSEVRVIAFGGSQESALEAIRTGELDKFFTAVPATQAVPIGYRLNYLKNSRVATLGLGTKYTESQCTPVPGTRSNYWHVSLQSVTSNGSCTGEYSRYARVEDGVSNYVLYPASRGPMVDTTVSRTVVFNVPVTGGSGIWVESSFTPDTMISNGSYSWPASCGDGLPTVDACLRGRVFDSSVDFAVNPYEFKQVITLPDENSGCTVDFNYQIFVEPALAPPPSSVAVR
jgi:hypothetical protein